MHELAVLLKVPYAQVLTGVRCEPIDSHAAKVVFDPSLQDIAARRSPCHLRCAGIFGRHERSHGMPDETDNAQDKLQIAPYTG